MPRKKTETAIQKKEQNEYHQTHREQPNAYDQRSGYKLYGYEDVQIPRLMRVPFVVTKYRFPGLTAGQCVWSMFEPHNEVVNIWTHLIGVVFFLVYVSKSIKTISFFDEPLTHPLLGVIIGSSTMLITSMCTHTFNSMSPYAYHICYFFDYAGISFSTFTFSQALFFYSRPLGTSWTLFNSPETYLSLSLLNSLVCTFTCCAVLIKRPWFHIFVRSSAYISLAIFTVLPYLGRLALCTLHPSGDCIMESAPHFKLVAIFFISGGIIYAFRIPECWMPKIFDFLGQSHNIFHTLSAFGTVQFFIAIYDEMTQRKGELLSMPMRWTELCVVFCVLAGILNFSLVLWFWHKLYSRQTKRH